MGSGARRLWAMVQGGYGSGPGQLQQWYRVIMAVMQAG